jgi:hypothetical protein
MTGAIEVSLSDLMDALDRNNGCQAKTARELNLTRGQLRHRLAKAHAFEVSAINPKSPLVLTGKSSLYKHAGDDGELILEWVKTKTTAQQQLAALRVAVDAVLNDIPRLPRMMQMKSGLCSDELHMITITDLHVGMYAWAEETGADWGLGICEEMTLNSVRYLSKKSNAAIGLLNLQGDFLHYSGTDAKTELHGHLLDADSRQSKMIRVAIRIIRGSIGIMLQQHSKVVVSIVPGNHDISATPFLAEFLSVLYELEPRIEIVANPRSHKIYIHGDVFLGFTHGHLKKMPGVSEMFAGMFPKEFGATEHRYIHMGHMHNEKMTENSLFKVVQHATIAAPDAYAANGGWLSKRQIRSITYHKKFGEVSNSIVRPEMLELKTNSI